jgi:phosphoglycerate-specific signal transduction histidine kinase
MTISLFPEPNGRSGMHYINVVRNAQVWCVEVSKPLLSPTGSSQMPLVVPLTSSTVILIPMITIASRLESRAAAVIGFLAQAVESATQPFLSFCPSASLSHNAQAKWILASMLHY